jgi:hypothetical protein
MEIFTMTKRHSIIFSLILLMSLSVSCLFQTAIAEQEKPTFPKTYEISDADAERYGDIMKKAIDTIPPLLRNLYPTIEEKAERWAKNPIIKESHGGFVDGLPTEKDITKEAALYLAYAAMDDKYGYTDDVLCLFYPDFTFHVANEEDPIWVIELFSFNEEVNNEFGNYHIWIHARTGVVESCFGPEDALG